MWCGAALVASASVTAAAVLVSNGARPLPAREPSGSVPADLAWAVFELCSRPADGRHNILGAWSIDLQDGLLSVDVSESESPADAVDAYEREVNGCLDDYRIGDPATVGFAYQPIIESPAERLLAYDVATRWLLPCIEGHDALSDVVPGVRDYLDARRATWFDLYLNRAVDFEDLLDARRDCGPPTQPYRLL